MNLSPTLRSCASVKLTQKGAAFFDRAVQLCDRAGHGALDFTDPRVVACWEQAEREHGVSLAGDVELKLDVAQIPAHGEQYTMVIAGLPPERQPTGVHTVERVEDGVVFWREGGQSPLHEIGGMFRRVSQVDHRA